MPQHETTEPDPERISEEIESARYHLYSALESTFTLAEHLPNASEIGTHIKQALACFRRWEKSTMADPTTTEPLRVECIGRAAPGHEKVLVLHFNREATDDEMQGIFDAVWKIVNEG